MRSMTVFNFLLEATVIGSVIILLVIAVRALLRDRLGSRAIYAAWLLVAVRLDLLVEETYARTAVLLFLIGNEGLSVLENLGLMVAPYPAFLKNALSVLREQGDRGKA